MKHMLHSFYVDYNTSFLNKLKDRLKENQPLLPTESRILIIRLIEKIKNGKLIHGTWQQLVFVELDTEPRNRNIIVQIVGE